MAELEGLHLVLAEGALEGERPLRRGSQATQDQLVVEVAEDGVLQAQVSLAVRNHQRQVADLEFSRLLRLQHLYLWVDLDILVLDLELTPVDLDLLSSRVLDDDGVRHPLANRTFKFNRNNLRVVLHRDLEGVENVLTRLLGLEGRREFVHACPESQEVQLVVFVAFSSDVKSLSSSDKETKLVLALDVPACIEALGLPRPVLDLDDEVALLLGGDSLDEGLLGFGRCRYTLQVVEHGRAVWQGEEEATLVRDVDHVLGIGDLLLLCHGLGQVGHLVIGIASRWDHESVLAREVALTGSTLCADRGVDSPFTVFRVLNLHRLCRFLPDYRLDGQLLRLRTFLGDALAH